MYSSYVLPPWLSILHLHWSKPKGDSGRIHFLRRRIRRFQRFVGDSGGLSAIYEHRRQRVARKQWGSEAWRFVVQRSAGDGDWGAPRSSSELTQYIIPIYGYGSIPINTIFRGMNIHLPLLYGYYMVIIWLLYAHDRSMVLVYMLTLIGGILMGSMEHHI